jgi:hypothetical protein
VGVDKAAGRAHGAVTRVNNFAFYGTFIAGGLARLSGIKFVGPVFGSLSKLAGSPRKYMDETTMREAVHGPSAALGAAGSRLQMFAGEDPERTGLRKMAARVAGGLSSSAERVAGVETRAATALKSGSARVFTPLGDAVEKVGSAQREGLAVRVAAKATGQHANALAGLEQVMAHGAGDAAMAPVHSALETARGLLGDGSARMGAEKLAEFQEALGTAGEGLAEAAKAGADKKTISALRATLDKVGASTGAFNQRSGIAEKIRDLPNAIRNAPESLAGANLTNVALKGAVVTGTTLQVTSVVRGVAEKVHSLKQMYCDLTGEEKISTRKLLMSKNMPPLVKEARGHIMKEYGPRVVLNFANTIATYGFMKNSSRKTMLVSGGLMALNQVHAAKVQGYGLLPVYQAMSQLPELQDSHYAVLISAASKDAAQAGGVESALVQAVSKEYAEEGARPVDVLKEINSGRFDERVNNISAANRKAMEGRSGHDLAPRPQNAGIAKEVIGPHTQRLQEQMSQARRQQTAGAAPMR